MELNKFYGHQHNSGLIIYYFIIMLAILFILLTFDKLSKTPISNFVDKSKKKIAQERLLCRSSLQTIDFIAIKYVWEFLT